jgi:Family of unknown function (DUF6152)
MRSLPIILVALSTLCVGGAASAHHSRAVYDLQKVTTIEGTVKEWKWSNPHTMLVVSVPNAKGATDDWVLEGGSPSFLSRQGRTRHDIKVGDKVSVSFNARKDGSKRGSGGQIKTGGKLIGNPPAGQLSD